MNQISTIRKQLLQASDIQKYWASEAFIGISPYFKNDETHIFEVDMSNNLQKVIPNRRILHRDGEWWSKLEQESPERSIVCIGQKQS